MRRLMTALALAGALGVAAYAQDTKVTTTTTTKADGAIQTLTYTGCVATGTQEKTYVLNSVVPVARTTTPGAAGTSGSTTTTYMLVPGEKVTIQEHVGHKVEVTGMMIPAGDVKTTTETKIDRDDAKDTKTKETVKTDNAKPEFRVTSIKSLAESCQ